MAARSHVDISVNERRLRPIYDCLDNGNNKKAVQEADKVLKKQKEFQCAKVLKALALLRLGKHEDATKYLQEVHSEVPTDDATLQAMTICYRELHKLDMIAEIYDLASQKDPQNEELLTHLFMAYVRLGQYKKQHLVAMSLYKLKAKNPYYFWGVMSIVMQAHVASKDNAQKMLLPLAERMTAKFVNENKIEAEAEVQLYLLILELEQKYSEALSVLDGPLGNKLTTFTNFKMIKRAELLGKLEKWPDVNLAYKELILQSPDTWLFYTEYLSSTMKLITSNYNLSNNVTKSNLKVDYTIEMAEAFLIDIIEKEKKKSSHVRAPYLAYIKLASLAREIQREDSIHETLVNLVTNYVQEFGDRPCCFLDLQNFLSCFLEEEKIKLTAVIRNSIHSDANEDSIPIASTVREMQRHLVYLELCQYFGFHSLLGTSEKYDFFNDLITRYQQGTKFGVDLAVTDFRSNDVYCLLAIHILMSMWEETADITIFDRSIIFLEYALKNSPSSYQIKFLLIKFYSKIGAVGPIYTFYENMDIKHIQQDVLGYLIIPQMIAMGHFSQACIVYGNMLKFYTANHKDTVDHLITSYKFGSFTKIQEFVDFRERLDNSFQYACVTVERMIQDLIFEISSHPTTEQMLLYMEIDPEKDKTVWEDLVDNRDLSIMVSWEPNFKQKMEEIKRTSFATELEWLKLRNLLIRCFSAGLLLCRHFNGIEEVHMDNCCNIENGSHRLPSDILQDLLQKFKDIIDNCKPVSSPLSKNFIQELPDSRIVAHIRGGFSRPVFEMFQLLLQLPKVVETNDISSNDRCENIIKNLLPKEFKNCMSTVEGSLTSEAFKDKIKVSCILENLVNIAEMVSFAAIILGFCEVILKPFRGGGTKKSRKTKKTQIQMPSILESFNDLITEIEKMTTTLSNNIHTLQGELLIEQFETMSLQNILSDSEQSKLVREIPNKIGKSYEQSLIEIEDLLRYKLKYLASLKL